MKTTMIMALLLLCSGCAYRTLEVRTPDGHVARASICTFVGSDATGLRVKKGDLDIQYDRKTDVDAAKLELLGRLAGAVIGGAL